MAMTEVTPTIDTATTIDASELGRVLGNAILFASKDRARPTLCNVKVDVADGAMTLEATDSYALIRETAEAVVVGAMSFMVDSKDAGAVVKACKAQKVGEVTVFAVGREVTFSGKGWSITADDESEMCSWPATANLWPTVFEGGAVTGVGLNQFARLGKVRVSASDEYRPALRLRLNGELKPFVAESATGALRVLVMPHRMA